MRGKTIPILGGGVGGLVTANRLRQELDEGHQVVLVEQSDRLFFCASYLWLMVV